MGHDSVNGLYLMEDLTALPKPLKKMCCMMRN